MDLIRVLLSIKKCFLTQLPEELLQQRGDTWQVSILIKICFSNNVSFSQIWYFSDILVIDPAQ